MKLFTAQQVRAWDAYTIREKNIRSVDLMETAAEACTNHILKLISSQSPIHIFCGPGNNGGDGLAITRLLHQKHKRVYCYILDTTSRFSDDHLINKNRLDELKIPVTYIREKDSFPDISQPAVLIDALFGTGLKGPMEGLAWKLIQYLNGMSATRISIDIPSGLPADSHNTEPSIFRADHTLSFQIYKRSFLFAENEKHTGKIQILDIGLSKQFYEEEPCDWLMTEPDWVQSVLLPRKLFSHKGNFGHAALAAGSRGMMGAAVLAAGACLQSGAGKLTCYVPSAGYEIMQTTRPEAMCIIHGNDFITEIQGANQCNALGIGPGLSMKPDAALLFGKLFQSPPAHLVIDADALNLLSANPDWFNRIPEQTLITPHPKEFDRLAGDSDNDWERLEKAIKMAKERTIFIILKGHFSRIIGPDGFVYFNPTGNAGMAKGGSGDVLTGLLTGLLAQGYAPRDAAILGTYLHGLSGDLAADAKTEMAMTASDLLDQLPHAWAQLQDT